VPQLAYAVNETPVPESTLVDLFFEGIDRWGDETAFQRFQTPDHIVDITYNETLEAVRKVSASLASAGLARGDRAAILSENRVEWAHSDYACLCAGVITVPIYPTLPADQVAYILQDSGARLVFVANEAQAKKVKQAADEARVEVSIVGFDLDSSDGVIGWADFLRSGAEQAESTGAADFRTAALEAQPHDLATVLYTSGTTGLPKGVMLTHNNIASNVRASVMILGVRHSDNTVSFLPLCHILQRMVDFLFFWTGCRIGYPQSLDTLIVDLGKLQPTVVVSVPRIYEKIYNGVMNADGFKKKLINWAVDVADRVADLRLAGKNPRGLLGLQYAAADKLVFSKVRARVGGRLRFFVSGGGPLAPALNRFFYSIGMTILEGYGLTETSPVLHVTIEDGFRIGWVGPPVPGTETRIADDGEILVRGPQIMKGYYNKPEATAEAIDEDGWFATGDIGELSADGYLRITDRKKDILVTAGGKNVAPQPIENHLKTHAFVEQAVLVGDRRRYCALIVVPAFGPLKSWANEARISWSTEADLVKNPDVIAHVEKELFATLSGFASFERPKKVTLIEEEFSVENGLLTPTLKVKRNVLREQFQDVIDALYSDEAADQTAN
jgi:long-chain acyl-CoA synthetase